MSSLPKENVIVLKLEKLLVSTNRFVNSNTGHCLYVCFLPVSIKELQSECCASAHFLKLVPLYFSAWKLFKLRTAAQAELQDTSLLRQILTRQVIVLTVRSYCNKTAMSLL
ncbi:hypothetical protein AMECASPLE_002803 [Ameca splendens]|uniref:Uncharacterized protein n=1 Tax=Ameca splendens TaxID=208324 RepID=A0ABV0ZVS3_9TELE